MLLWLLAACAPKAAVPAADAEHPLLVWRVEREGKVSHLLGTCHMGVKLDYALPKPHDAALAGARVVYTEADLALGSPIEAVRLLWSDGPGLSTRMEPERWRAVAAAVRDTVPASLLEHFEPWVVATMIPFATGGGGKAPAVGKGMDQEVQERAAARGIPVRHVETLAEQAAMLRQWNDAFLAELGPGEAEDAQAETDAVSALCFRGDTRVADAVTEPGDPVADALLRGRNRAWVPKLLPDLAEGGAFVAVGAGHMLGDDGLVDLLQEQGFTVSQLTTGRRPSDAQLPVLGGHVPPAPPAPPTLAAIEGPVAAEIARGLCQAGQPVRACFEPDEAKCVARLTADAVLCVRQWADLLPTDGREPPAAFKTGVANCVPAGLALEAVAAGRVGDGFLCEVIEKSLDPGR